MAHAHSHGYICTVKGRHSERHDILTRTHPPTHTFTVFLSPWGRVHPAERNWLFSLKGAGALAVAAVGAWVDTGRNGSHWQTAALSPAVTTTNTDLRHALHFVTGVICSSQSAWLHYAFICGQWVVKPIRQLLHHLLITDYVDEFSK